MNTGTGMNEGIHNPAVAPPDMNNPIAHTVGSGVNNINHPPPAQGAANPAMAPPPQQAGVVHNPAVAANNNAAAPNTMAGDPALAAQQPHAHGAPVHELPAHEVPANEVPPTHGGHVETTNQQHTSSSRATGAGEKLGHKLKSAAAQGQGLGDMLRGNFNAAVDTAVGDTRGQDKNEQIARAGEDKINRAQEVSRASQRKPLDA